MQELTIKQKLTNYYYFIAINSILLSLLGIGYFIRDHRHGYLLLPKGNDLSGVIYLIISHFLHVVLYLFFCSILLLPTLWIDHKKRKVIQLCVVIFAISLAILDILMFYLHGINVTDTFISICYNAIIVNLITNFFSLKKIILVAGFLLFCVLEYFLYYLIENKNWLKKYSFGKKYFLFVLTCTISITAIYISSDKNRRQSLVAYTQHLPWIIIGNKQVINKIDSINKQIVLTKFSNFISNNNKKLNYPTKPLITSHVNNPPNILIIAIDGWRSDCFNEKDSPNLWKFAQNGRIFYNHKSAANSTLGGIFSLFYSIPASYWHSFLENKCIPVLFDRLQQLDYQIGMFTSFSPLEYFMKQENILKAKLDVKINANLGHEKDKLATNSLLNWYKTINDKEPWFAFIFYKSAHDHNFPEDYSSNCKPINNNAIRYNEIVRKDGKDYFIATYKLAIHYADHLAGKILTELKETEGLKNTIVIITSDHAKEFNETKQDVWGYGTNFTNYQIQIPFAIVCPKFNVSELDWQKNDLTTNYDVIPTLMQNFLGVTNDINDYSIGIDLLKNRNHRDWMFATGFSFYSFYCGIIDNELSMNWLPSGRYWFTDNMNRNLSCKTINNKLLEQAFEYMTRFIKK